MTILRQYAAMPAGIIRGVLSRVGLSSTVSPEITSMPQCEYTHFLCLTFLTIIVKARFRSSYQKDHDYDRY